MSETKYMPVPFAVGWGAGLTGPTTPTFDPCCGDKWPYEVISFDKKTIAIIPAQESGTHSFKPEAEAKTKARTAFIVLSCNSHYDLLAERDRLKVVNAKLLEAMGKITEGAGVFNRDPLKHAENVITASVKTAEAAIAQATKGASNV